MYARFLKRPFDLIISIILLLFFSWLFILIILAYAITFEWPILFTQERIGKDERPFKLYKFRTLKPETFAVREFWLGRFLRFTSLDELPQLVNVLRGEMSLIGPRPLPTLYLSRFSNEQRKRHQVRPGITGWAQVNGRNSISWTTKFNYDLAYVERCSFLFDLGIIIRTILLLLSFSKDVSLLEEEFTGKE